MRSSVWRKRRISSSARSSFACSRAPSVDLVCSFRWSVPFCSCRRLICSAALATEERFSWPPPLVVAEASCWTAAELTTGEPKTYAIADWGQELQSRVADWVGGGVKTEYLKHILPLESAQLSRPQFQLSGGAVQQLNVRRRLPVLGEKTTGHTFCLRHFQIGRTQVRNGADYCLIGGDEVEDGAQRNGQTEKSGQHKEVRFLGSSFIK
ncbi:hypothetical protein TYRP_005226 [Tyrophagus putrescentiae]|nr:hypothetical protein TYRP_005226 [Tyrophagus putrescentiae]